GEALQESLLPHTSAQKSLRPALRRIHQAARRLRPPPNGRHEKPPAHSKRSDPMIKVRPAVRADCPGILEIYNDAVLKTTASYDYEPRTLEHRQSWFEDHQQTGLPIF